MSVAQLERLAKITKYDAEVERIKIELRKREAIVSINDILEKFGFNIEDLYEELVDPKIREIIEGRYEKPTKQREESIPRYRLNGKNYDGRQARRAKEFSRYVKDGRIDVALVVKEGAFNPEWFNKQKERVLFSMGINDREAYKLKHGL
ncbi:MAG: hypothetical protein BA874_11460 [Desulfuromonadales bacterium C00003068]|nr:MAG: hypothetical protein BA874_11460 [Desulfuromonadales bacterium C00003068]